MQSSSLVHSIETSAFSKPPNSYRDFKRRGHEKEWQISQQVYSYIDARDGSKRLRLYEGCRSFASFLREKLTGKVKVTSNACRLRWCPVCAVGKQYHIKNAVQEWLSTFDRPKFVTFTLQHTSAPLSSQIDALYKFFRLLRQVKDFRVLVWGGVWFFQVKRSKETNEWHPHLHCVWKGAFFNQKKLSELWLRVTKTSNIVDIRMIKSHKKIAEYVARYCAKPASLKDYTLEDRLTIFDAMHGRRLSGKWGCAKGLKLSVQKFTEQDKWTKLATYSYVISELEHSHIAREIIKHWMAGTSIPAHLKLIGPRYGEKSWDESRLPPVGVDNLILEGYS